jgi:hypothetical protein
MAPKSSGSLQSVILAQSRGLIPPSSLYAHTTRHRIEGWIRVGLLWSYRSALTPPPNKAECSLLAQTSPLRHDAESESGFGCRF